MDNLTPIYDKLHEMWLQIESIEKTVKGTTESEIKDFIESCVRDHQKFYEGTLRVLMNQHQFILNGLEIMRDENNKILNELRLTKRAESSLSKKVKKLTELVKELQNINKPI